MAALAGLVLAATGTATATASPGPTGHAAHWVTSWTASPTAADSSGLSAAGLDDQTVREVVHTSLGGPALRVRLTNRYGDRPVSLDDVTVGAPDGAALDRAVPLTFGGRRHVTLPPGADIASDAVRLPVAAQQNLAVSLHTPAATGPATWHHAAHTTSYVAAGDHARDLPGTAFTTRITSWYFLDAVDVLAAPPVGAIVALGHSITDGTGTADDSNTRWTDDLSRRIDPNPGANADRWSTPASAATRSPSTASPPTSASAPCTASTPTSWPSPASPASSSSRA